MPTTIDFLALIAPLTLTFPPTRTHKFFVASDHFWKVIQRDLCIDALPVESRHAERVGGERVHEGAVAKGPVVGVGRVEPGVEVDVLGPEAGVVGAEVYDIGHAYPHISRHLSRSVD